MCCDMFIRRRIALRDAGGGMAGSHCWERGHWTWEGVFLGYLYETYRAEPRVP